MWQPTDKVRRSLAVGIVCFPLVLFAIPVSHLFWVALDFTVHSTFATSIPAILRDIAVCIYVAVRIFMTEGQKGLKEWAQKGKDAAFALAMAFVLTFLYNLFFAAPQQIAQGNLESDPFVVSVEFARVSVGGNAYGTSLWIRYPSRDGSCGGISPIQGMYFLSIKNRLAAPVSVVGYGIDSLAVPLTRVRTRMGIVVGTPNAIDGHFLHPKLHLSDIKVGSFFDFGQGPGFSMATVPLNQSDFLHGLVLKMDLIDDLLQKPLQPGTPVRGWVFLQANDNALTIAGAGHVILETDESKTYSYAFDLKNPHSALDNMHRVITVESFIDLSDCPRP